MMIKNTNLVIRAVLLTIVLAFLAYIVSAAVGLGGGGFDSEFILQQYTFYLSGAVGLAIVLGAFFIERLIKQRDEQYGNSVGYVDHGEFPGISVFKKVTGLQMFLASSIIFGIIGLLIHITSQRTFTSLQVLKLEQQFTPVGSLLFSSLLIPIAENAGLAAVIAVFLIYLRGVARKGEWSPINFRITAIAGSTLLAGIYWFIQHILRYGGSELSLTVVFIFGAIGGLMTILTSSFIPFWVMHLANNLFFDLRRSFDNDLVIFYTIGVLVALVALYIYLYFIRKKKDFNPLT